MDILYYRDERRAGPPRFLARHKIGGFEWRFDGNQWVEIPVDSWLLGRLLDGDPYLDLVDESEVPLPVPADARVA